MNQAFERHAAYMDQAWRTLQDSVLLKESNKSPYVGPHRKRKRTDMGRDAEEAMIREMAGLAHPLRLPLVDPTPKHLRTAVRDGGLEGKFPIQRLGRRPFATEQTGQSHTLSNIHRIVADSPDAADRRHCQSQGCQAMVKPGDSYCASCVETGDATDTQGIDREGNYGTERNQ